MPDREPIPDRAWFTPLLNRIADAAGERAALILGHEKAGEQIYIPENIAPDHWLAVMIGHEAAVAMSQSFGSQKMVIPPALNGNKRRRARAIAEMVEKGYSLNKIVRMTGLARSTVQEHMARHKRPSDQGSLF